MSARATETGRGWRLSRPLSAAMLLGLALALLGGCVDEDVFVERAFDEPTDLENRFLGYFGDPADKLTACGNCHATYQGGWVQTGHADAWAGLQSSDHAADYCEPCHTISEAGNTLEGEVGWVLTGDPRYHDVQCESCHGSGWQHVNDPKVETAPLCSVEAATDATVGCGECHAGEHHPFVEQWESSRHGTTPAWEESSSTRTSSRCTPCHEGKGALVATFGEYSNYLEKSGTDPLPIMCVVCHDPHSAEFEGQLRASIAAHDRTNLCVGCHANRGMPPSSHGPHGAQGLLVLGEGVGWIPPDYLAPSVDPFLPEAHAHGGSGNEELCATCHVARFSITEPEAFNSVGHTFQAIACLDEEGKPTTEEECDVTERDFRACTECHASEEEARTDFLDLKAELNVLLDSLWTDTNGDCVMDPFPTDAGLLPRVVALGDTTDLDPRDDLITVAEGAYWNAQLAYTSDRECFGEAHLYVGLAGEDTVPGTLPPEIGIHASAHKASGEGVHNPELLEALLSASIEAVVRFYFPL